MAIKEGDKIEIRAVIGSHKWALYNKKEWFKIATFNDQFTAYQMRLALYRGLGYYI